MGSVEAPRCRRPRPKPFPKVRCRLNSTRRRLPTPHPHRIPSRRPKPKAARRRLRLPKSLARGCVLSLSPGSETRTLPRATRSRQERHEESATAVKGAAIAVVMAGIGTGRAAGAARSGHVHDQRHHHRPRRPVAGRVHYGAPATRHRPDGGLHGHRRHIQADPSRRVLSTHRRAHRIRQRLRRTSPSAGRRARRPSI